jgi:hypothetical protein
MQRLELEVTSHQPRCGLGQQHRVGLRNCLDARGDVHGLSHRQSILSAPQPDITHDGDARVESHPRVNLGLQPLPDARVDELDRIQGRQARSHCAYGVILVRHGVAEIG